MRNNTYIVVSVAFLLFFINGTVLAQGNNPPNDLGQAFERRMDEILKANTSAFVNDSCESTKLTSNSFIQGFALDGINSLVPSFSDITATACYRDMLWNMEDQIDKQLVNLNSSSYAACVVDSDDPLKKELSDQKSVEEAKIQNIHRGLQLLRNFGPKATLSPDELRSVLGVNSISAEVWNELLGDYKSDDTNPYYSPFFRRDTLFGFDNFPESDIPLSYKEYAVARNNKNSSDENSSDKSTFEKNVDAYKEVSAKKWSTMENKLRIFLSQSHLQLSANTPDVADADVVLYPNFYKLSSSDRVNLYRSLRAFYAAVPNMLQFVSGCGVSGIGGIMDGISKSVDNFTGALDNFVDTFTYPFTDADPNSKAHQQIIKRRVDRLLSICSRLEAVYVRAGRSLHELPIIAVVDKVAYCPRPVGEDTSFSDAYKAALNATTANVQAVRGVGDLVLQDEQISTEELMIQLRSEQSRFLQSIDTSKLYAQYQALYENSSLGSTNSLQESLDSFIKVIERTTQAQEANPEPVLFAIFKTLWNVQNFKNGSGCSACDVVYDDFKITPH
jgi:hypothetical protein